MLAQIMPVMAEENPDVHILRVVNSGMADIDPATGSDGSSTQAMINLYDPLVSEDQDGNLAPALATEWTISEDGLTWNFKLREDVKFHDGSDFNAEDVVYSMNRLKDIGAGEAYLFGKVESVEAVSDYEVEFRLSETYGVFLTALTKFYIVNKELLEANLQDGDYGENGDYGVGFLQTTDAGCGAYQVTEYETGASVTAVKFDDYWAGWGENPVEKVRFISSDEAETVRTLMSNGDLEMADEYQTPETNDLLASMEGISVFKKPTTSQDVIMLNTQRAPLDDVHVRKALAYAFDYTTAVNSIFPGSSKAKGCVPSTMAGFNEEALQYDQDLAKAQEELAASAYADTIADYPVEISWCSGVNSQEQMALLFQACAMSIGINVQVTEYEWTTLCDAVSGPETTPNAVVMEIGNAYNDMGSELQTTFSSQNTGVWSNTTWLNDAELDAAIEDALSTPEPEARYEKYKAIQDTVMDLCPCIWVVDTVMPIAYRSAVLTWPMAEKAEAGEAFSRLKQYYFHDYTYIG